jgi:hypothetical protein
MVECMLSFNVCIVRLVMLCLRDFDLFVSSDIVSSFPCVWCFCFLVHSTEGIQRICFLVHSTEGIQHVCFLVHSTEGIQHVHQTN